MDIQRAPATARRTRGEPARDHFCGTPGAAAPHPCGPSSRGVPAGAWYADRAGADGFCDRCEPRPPSDRGRAETDPRAALDAGGRGTMTAAATPCPPPRRERSR